MLKQVILARNPMEPDTWTHHEVKDVRDFLLGEFTEWPSTARIYHKQVSASADVTPSDEATIERLGELPGPFYVVVYPADPVTIVIAVVAVVVVAAVVLAAAKPPIPTLRNTQNQSPNNELSDRSNNPRPLARIPDIFGTVRSTPDLLAVPYKVFKDHEEVEYAYMCIGRGSYDVSDVRDDNTLVIDIPGTSVEVYGPNTSPNSGHAPQLRIGTPINTPVRDVSRSNSVNGQVLRPPNDQSIRGDHNIYFQTPNLVKTGAFDFTDKFAAGDTLYVSEASVYQAYINQTKTLSTYSDGFCFVIPDDTLPSEYAVGAEIQLTGALFSVPDPSGYGYRSYDLSGVYTIASKSLETVTTSNTYGPTTTTTYYCRVVLNSPASTNPNWDSVPQGASTPVGIRLSSGAELYNLNGTYTVLSVADDTITLSNPAAVNPAWSSLTTSPNLSPTLCTTGSKWVGPFVLDKSNTNVVAANFVATNGLYKDDGKNQVRFDVTLELEITPINADGSVRGAVQTAQATVEGSATYRSTRAVTLDVPVDSPGRVRVRARRVTNADLDFEGSVVDEVKWRDVYAMAPIGVTDFGNVTTVQAVTYATAGALALKERKLNMLVTRKIPLRVSGSTFTSDLHATNDAEEILSAICLDPYLGNRPASEIDFDNLYHTVQEVRDYFGTDLAAEFCYTFDADNLSFEETAQTVARAVFCIAYRRGNIIKLNFERETEDSLMLFNHRNKLPGSEVRTVRFGNQNNYDGVSLKYVSPDDDAVVNYYIPENRTAVNPQEVETLGVRNGLQAYFHAWRAWNKIRYQNVISEFTATQEADLLVTNDRVLVADNTRTGTQDGEVLDQQVLQLRLSQPVSFKDGVNYNIFIQHVDGTVESIGVSPGEDQYHVILSQAPRLPLAVGEELYARTSYILIGDDEPRGSAFLIVEKEPQSNFTSTVRAVNYDPRYYSKDLDYINGLVNENGLPTT